MHLSPSFRGLVLSLALALAAPCISHAQTAYSSSGGEHLLPASLPGTQSHPTAAVTASGGFVIWEDNSADKDGLGLRAQALDSEFSPAGAFFRVNKSGARDQEHPRIALPSGGGAVFVWQGGRAGQQRIYARFLSSSNPWFTTDLLVSTNKRPQNNPVVTALANGNVVILWASLNQASASSMFDVFGQIFTTTGQRVGSQFLVNQFTAYNQRDPAVTALNDGRFLVAWVSEQQNSGGPDTVTAYTATNPPIASSVDIYARFFGNDGLPAAPEFIVNTGPEICNSPAVAADTNGGFVVSWSQKNPDSRANGWDIAARYYSSTGPGPSRIINTYLPGDQYAPQAGVAGTNYLIIWTSAGQASAAESVYGQYLDGTGSPVAGEFPVNTTAIKRRIAPTPALATDSTGRFLTLWTAYTGARTALDVFAQTYVSSDFVAGPTVSSVYAAPPPEVFDDSSGDPSTPPVLDPPPVVSTPGTNAFSFAKVAYNGLFYDKTNGVSPSSSGFFTLSSTAQGALSAKFTMAGRSYSMSARFDSAGRATGKISRGSLHALNVQFQADSSGSVQGTVSDGHWVADIFGNRIIGSTTKSLASTFVGNYTLDIPGISVAGYPGGDGYGTAKADSSGNVRFAGSLADSTKMSQTAALSEKGLWPVYASLYQGLGQVIGWVQFSTNGAAGQLVWIKQSAAAGKIYPTGFTNRVDTVASLYRAPAKGQRVLPLSNGNGNVALTGGGMNNILNSSISLDLNNRVSSDNPTLKLSITASTGLFKGSVLNPDTGQPISFQGALFPDRNLALGYFLGTAGAGQISVEAAQ